MHLIPKHYPAGTPLKVVKLRVTYGGISAGMIAGFEVGEADKLLKNGDAEFVSQETPVHVPKAAAELGNVPLPAVSRAMPSPIASPPKKR